MHGVLLFDKRQPCEILEILFDAKIELKLREHTIKKIDT